MPIRTSGKTFPRTWRCDEVLQVISCVVVRGFAVFEKMLFSYHRSR